MAPRFELPVSRAVWLRLFLGALLLAGACLLLWREMRQLDAVLGADGTFGGGTFGLVGAGALAAAALLFAARPRSGGYEPRGLREAAGTVMPCGGVMTEAAFGRGGAYGYCSKRCVHSRTDFEARVPRR